MRPKVSGDSPRYLLQGLVEAELKLGLADSKPLCFSAPSAVAPGQAGQSQGTRAPQEQDAATGSGL